MKNIKVVKRALYFLTVEGALQQVMLRQTI